MTGHDMFLGMATGIAFFYLLILSLSVWLIPAIFYLISVQAALKAVSPKNRSLDPALVWLYLIPVFNLVWQFFIVVNVSGSLKREYAQRQAQAVGDCGYGLGIAMCIVSLCAIIPIFWFFMWLVALVLWVIYWVKIVELKNGLQTAQP